MSKKTHDDLAAKYALPKFRNRSDDDMKETVVIDGEVLVIEGAYPHWQDTLPALLKEAQALAPHASPTDDPETKYALPKFRNRPGRNTTIEKRITRVVGGLPTWQDTDAWKAEAMAQHKAVLAAKLAGSQGALQGESPATTDTHAAPPENATDSPV
jgi:hypothetical protein